MGNVDRHVVRAQRAFVGDGRVTLLCGHAPLPAGPLAGQLVLANWFAVDDRGRLHRAADHRVGSNAEWTTVEVSFPGIPPDARWIDIVVAGPNGERRLGVRVPLSDDGHAPVPVLPPDAPSPPPGPLSAALPLEDRLTREPDGGN